MASLTCQAVPLFTLSRTRAAACLAGLFMLGGVSASAQTIHLIQLHSPPLLSPLPRTTSGDGFRVMGQGGPSGAWQWTVAGGYQPLPGVGTAVESASFSGTVTVGTAAFPGGTFTQCAYWADGFGIPLNPGLVPGYASSAATDITKDASIIVGYAQNPIDSIPLFVAVRWAAGGFIQLPPAPGYTTSRRAHAISGDGQYIFGTSFLNGGNSVPTRWGPTLTAQSMGMPPGETSEAIPVAASDNGSVAMGNGVQVHTWRWIEGVGYQSIASPPGTTARPQDMTSGGETIVGSVYLNQDNSYAAFWTQSGQWIDLNAWLPTQGLNLNGWLLTTCYAVSDDGRVLAGTGFFNGQPAAWAITGIRSVCGPRIQSQTLATSKCSGQNAQISVSAVPPGSPGAVSYQWYRRYYLPLFPYENNVQLTNGPTGNGSTISGANLPNLFINNVKLQDAGYYWCELFAGCTSVYTDLATLTVLPDISGNGGGIDTNDLTIILGNFGSTVTPWTNGDLNGDGAVNTLDLTIFLGAFGTSCP